MDTPTPPKVFISYSWDSDEHKAWILNLAEHLLANGVDVTLDQFELSLGKNLSLFMEKAVSEANKVLLILTENYKLKAEKRTGGVGYEYSMINSALYKTQANNNKFLPVLRGKDRDASTPIFVDAFINLDMRDDAQFDATFEELLRAIYESPKVVKPELGKRPAFLSPTTMVESITTDKIAPPSVMDLITGKMTNLTNKHDATKALLGQKQQLRKLIGQNKTKDALKVLAQIAEDQKDSDLENTAILLSSQFEDNARQSRLGIATPESLRIGLNRINASLLEIIKDLT